MALLTADTYRIAAAEQLRTYANILETPFRVIYTPEELQTAVKDYWDCDYTFYRYSGEITSECGSAGENEGNGGSTERPRKLSCVSGSQCNY